MFLNFPEIGRHAIYMLITLLVCPMQEAWGIDCSKKDNSPTARAMCADPALVTQDEYLTGLYKYIQQNIKDPHVRTELKNDEINWIKSRNKKCSDNAECISYDFMIELIPSMT